jgi:serine/threonine protein kinase
VSTDPQQAFSIPAETLSSLLDLGLNDTEPMIHLPEKESVHRVENYSLERTLGRGGMGEVWLATDVRTGASVAIKWLHAELAYDASSVHRFQREAKHMSGLSHPHIVTLLQVGEHQGRPYYVAPLFRQSLSALIARTGALSEKHILAIARPLADALAYAHGRGIIHRDVKPANVLLDDNDHPYLGDFGLVRTVFNDSMINVQKKTLEGTIAYMSPATAAGQAEDTRCDIYGWGAVVYEMLTGHPPYEASSTEALLAAVRSGPPRPVDRVNPLASKGLARIVAWAMARELRDRYAEMNDILADLDRVHAGRLPVGPHGGQTERRFGVAIVLAVVVVVAALGLGVLLKKKFTVLQDGGNSLVVLNEDPTQQEIEKMKTTTMMTIAAILASQPISHIHAQGNDKPSGIEKPVTLVAPYPKSDGKGTSGEISLQYAVIDLAKQIGFTYDFHRSQKNVGEISRHWVQPQIRNVPFREAMKELLAPLGVAYDMEGATIVLVPGISLNKPYPQPYADAPTDKISLQFAVEAIARQAGLTNQPDVSRNNLGDKARIWVTPDIQNESLKDALDQLLKPHGVKYRVSDGQIILLSE